ncbi:MAG: hypothetical protein K2J80_07360, partial [Oscillospiraceae bacterium]|nr:hypothetical protein [Oscillospiraceae bacterium]
MKKYKVQPLDLMQFVNTKYHEPFIHEHIEFDGALDGKRLAEALDLLIGAFPILKCRYDASENVFAENERILGKELVKEVENADRNVLLTESLD